MEGNNNDWVVGRCLVNVQSVKIVVSGNYDLTRLRKLGYQQSEAGWYFDGKLHRYTFRQGMGREVVITVAGKPFLDRPLPHRLTFGQIDSWVTKSVNVIQLRGR